MLSDAFLRYRSQLLSVTPPFEGVPFIPSQLLSLPSLTLLLRRMDPYHVLVKKKKENQCIGFTAGHGSGTCEGPDHHHDLESWKDEEENFEIGGDEEWFT